MEKIIWDIVFLQCELSLYQSPQALIVCKVGFHHIKRRKEGWRQYKGTWPCCHAQNFKKYGQKDTDARSPKEEFFLFVTFRHKQVGPDSIINARVPYRASKELRDLRHKLNSSEQDARSNHQIKTKTFPCLAEFNSYVLFWLHFFTKFLLHMLCHEEALFQNFPF